LPETGAEAVDEAVIAVIADWLCQSPQPGAKAMERAQLALWDAVACAWSSLADPSAARLLGPFWGDSATGTIRTLAANQRLDPLKAAFDTSLVIRWQDLSDTGMAGGHPSDNIGALLSALQWLAQRRKKPSHVADLLVAMCQAYEIQHRLALANRFDRGEIGIDHVIAVRIASAAVSCRIMGGGREAIRAAIGHAFLDAGPLNAYRQLPNSGPRKGWAGPDASARGLLLGRLATAGEPELPAPLSDSRWGFSAVCLKGAGVRLPLPLEWDGIETVIFKLVPAQRNALTAAEAAFQAHEWLGDRVDSVSCIHVGTHPQAIQRIVREGPLPNAAARDHCLQYIVAAALLYGTLSHESYTDATAADPRIERLRSLVTVAEDPAYARSPDGLACPNKLSLTLGDGRQSPVFEVLKSAGDSGGPDAAKAIRSKLLGTAERCFGKTAALAFAQRMIENGPLERMHLDAFLDMVSAN
jgi:2-methylcitrate dehydratase